MSEETSGKDKVKTAAAAGSKKNKKRSLAPVIMFLFCLLAGAALALSGYLYHERLQMQKQLDSFRAGQEKIAGLEASVGDLQSANRRLQQSIEELSNKQQSLATGLAAANKRQGKGQRSRLLADVQDLLVIAVQRLTLAQDVPVALAAMQSADARLRDYNDPELLPLRRQITADINSLRAVPRVDISGLALYLLDIAARVGKLPLKKLPEATNAKQGPANGKTAKSALPFWRRLADEILDTLKGLVKVYHHGEGSLASLMPDQRYYLYQNLRLQLETATRAVLHGETQNFHTAIKIIQDWLRKNFDTDDPAVSNIVDALDRMAKVELQPKLPDISSSLETVKALIRAAPAATPGSDETQDSSSQ